MALDLEPEPVGAEGPREPLGGAARFVEVALPEPEGDLAGETSRQADDSVLVFGDRKSTRLNSSHLVISYAVFCLKKKHSSRTAFLRLSPLGTCRRVSHSPSKRAGPQPGWTPARVLCRV